MPLTSTESERILKAIATAYVDLWVRQQALAHVLGEMRGQPTEGVERDLQAWREQHYEAVGAEAGRRLLDLLRGMEIVRGDPTDPPPLP